MFKKKQEPRAGGASVAPGGRITAAESAISIIGPGMTIEGDISTDGIVRVEGTIQGTIRAGKAVVLGKEAFVRGNIFTQDAVIGGRVTGTLVAESRLEMQSTCVIEGEVRARAEHIKLDEGARFNGQITMLDGEAGALPAPAPPPPPLEVPTPLPSYAEPAAPAASPASAESAPQSPAEGPVEGPPGALAAASVEVSETPADTLVIHKSRGKPKLE